MKKRSQNFGALSKVNLRLLEIFARVAEEGSMNAAAEQLGMSQAAVSQGITALEESLGLKLFDRSVRPSVLTLVGASALRLTTEAAGKLRELENLARAGSPGRVPLLRIGMLDSFTATAGVGMLDQLRDVAAEWTVTSGARATSMQALLERRCDAVITSEDRAIPPEVDARQILSEALQLVVPKSHKARIVDLRSVASELDFIRYGRDSNLATVIDEHLERSGVPPKPRYRFDTTDAALRMTAGGFGWTVVTPLVLLKSMVPLDAVRVVRLPGPAMRRTLWVAMRRGENGEILERIRAAALKSLREVVQPQIRRMLPRRADEFVIPKDD
jgi:DNA-binding transcriptional LysR family regulator